MNDIVIMLYIQTMQTALALAMPVVVVVGFVGVVISFAQTLVGIQDQNLSFGPKIAAVAVILAVGGAPAMTVLTRLLLLSITTVSQLAG